MSDLPPCCYENEDGWHYCQEGLKLYRIAQKLNAGMQYVEDHREHCEEAYEAEEQARDIAGLRADLR